MEERKGFGSNFGFLMAAIGSAVGLGNIWGFPNKMGANGGFTFLIIYLILAACCGFIVMVGELAIGRKTGAGAVRAYQMLSKRFKWIGWMGVASAFLIMSFYCALGGYCLKYTVLNFGNLIGAGQRHCPSDAHGTGCQRGTSDKATTAQINILHCRHTMSPL